MRSAGPVENTVRASIQPFVYGIAARRAEHTGCVHVPRFDSIARRHMRIADCITRRFVSQR